MAYLEVLGKGQGALTRPWKVYDVFAHFKEDLS